MSKTAEILERAGWTPPPRSHLPACDHVDYGTRCGEPATVELVSWRNNRRQSRFYCDAHRPAVRELEVGREN